MDIAVIENSSEHHRKHDWMKIFYMIIAALCLIIEFSQRIYYTSYTNTYLYIPSINRFPTEFTISNMTITWIWYIVYIWQILSFIYSFIGIFRRTSFGCYFYQYPCAMNDSIYFYIILALLHHIPILLFATNNIYQPVISVYRHLSTFVIVFLAFIILNERFQSNLQDYFRNQYVLDVWLVRIFYQNGLSLWLGILFYESCLSIIIALIYTTELSPLFAYIIGICIFLIGLILVFIYENFLYDHYLILVLSHWLMFYWLIWDIQYIVKKQFSLSFYNVTFIPLTYYLIVLFTAARFVSFYLYFRRRQSTGRIYTLLERSRRVF